jgi:nucleoside 2-deoxyribosyltransferase
MKPKTIYFAGELFSLKHLLGNAVLAQHIQERGEERYRCALPQTLEQRGTTTLDIRNQDIQHVMQADLCICNFDGPEIDGGTIVEFMIAKFLDIPVVLLRTDFRKGGDHESGFWNLMLAGYPRVQVLTYDAMGMVRETLDTLAQGEELSFEMRTKWSIQACEEVSRHIAKDVVAACDALCASTPVMPKELRSAVEQWAHLFPGGGFADHVPEVTKAVFFPE